MKIIKTPAEIDTRLKSFVVVADSETAMKNSIDIVREYGYEIKILDFWHKDISCHYNPFKYVISWSINLLFLERKANMYEILFEEHSKMVEVMDIILFGKEYELKASEFGSIWINILDDSKIIDVIIIAQAQAEPPLWLNVNEIEMKFTQTYNKKHEIKCSWQIRPVKWY